MKCLENKVCLVTGAGRGIGRVIAEQLALDGAIVYANDLLIHDLNEWTIVCSEKYNTRIIPICFDVTDSSQVKENLMYIFRKEGRLDSVINNAAIIANQKLGMITKSLLLQLFSVNVFAILDIIQIASRLMARGGGGNFVNIASVTALDGSSGQVAYSSTKGAVISLTKSSAKELASMNIRVNAVAPGIINSDRFNELYQLDSAKIDDRISKIALKRIGTPQDIANAVSFLISDKASYISGHILRVDGCSSI